MKESKINTYNVSIIIVNYNTLQTTSNCIESIFLRTKDVSFEIILIDNASTDGSKEFFEKDNRIKYIYSNENLGFGRANNIGMQQAAGEYYFLLNSDTYLLNNAVEIFYKYAKQSTNKFCIYGTWLLNEKMQYTHSYGKFPTIKSELYNALRVYTSRMPFIKNIITPYKENIYASELNVDYITGADMFIPRSVIDKSGMFDPAFFMYYEESEWQKRMQNYGISRILIKGPEIVHLNRCNQNKSMTKLINSTKGMFIYLKKQYKRKWYLLFRIAFFIIRFPPIIFSNTYKLKQKLSYLMFIAK